MLDILRSASARAGLRRGMGVSAAAVAATLGPCGRPVVVGDPRSPLRVARTGLAVARSMHFDDRAETIGAALLGQVAEWTQEAAGDGTARAVAIAHVLARESINLVGLGFDPRTLRDGIDAAAAEVERHLAQLTLPAVGIDAMRCVATTAAGDAKLGRLVADAASQAGTSGLVVVEEAPAGAEPHVDLVEGLAIGSGYASPTLITLCGRGRERRRLHRPLVLLIRGYIGHPEALLPALEHARRTRRPLLIVAEGASANVVASLRSAGQDATVQVLVVELAPAETSHAVLYDLAALTGATVGDQPSMALAPISAAALGDAAVVLADASHTVVAGFRGHGGRPRSGLAVLRAGSRGSEESADMRVRAERAAYAVHAAALHGVVPGGGVALLSAARALTEPGTNACDRYIRLGHSLLQRALDEPFRQLMQNAGITPTNVMRRLADHDRPDRAGVSLPSGEVVDVVAAGILDPLHTVRAMLRAAVSGTGLLLATEALAMSHRSSDGEVQEQFRRAS